MEANAGFHSGLRSAPDVSASTDDKLLRQGLPLIGWPSHAGHKASGLGMRHCISDIRESSPLFDFAGCTQKLAERGAGKRSSDTDALYAGGAKFFDRVGSAA